MKFSQRTGKTSITKQIQLEYIDEDLKNRLWNLLKIYYLDIIIDTTEFPHFTNALWHNFYKLPIDTIPPFDYQTEAQIRNRFFDCVWYEVYDFIEYILQLRINSVDKQELIKLFNKVLENEFSAYRIIDKKIAPISNKLEYEDISLALEKTGDFTLLQGANIHIENSLTLISDKKNPDYRNSIKEAISAVEATCRIITGESTLGKALNKLEEKGLNINQQIKLGFDKIYAYTNDKQNGIRHAIVEEPIEPDFNDAKYMLVSCSAFINYLIGKADNIGIKIES